MNKECWVFPLFMQSTISIQLNEQNIIKFYAYCQSPPKLFLGLTAWKSTSTKNVISFHTLFKGFVKFDILNEGGVSFSK